MSCLCMWIQANASKKRDKATRTIVLDGHVSRILLRCAPTGTLKHSCHNWDALIDEQDFPFIIPCNCLHTVFMYLQFAQGLSQL